MSFMSVLTMSIVIMIVVMMIILKVKAKASKAFHISPFLRMSFMIRAIMFMVTVIRVRMPVLFMMILGNRSHMMFVMIMLKMMMMMASMVLMLWNFCPYYLLISTIIRMVLEM